jgi:plastocyanin
MRRYLLLLSIPALLIAALGFASGAAAGGGCHGAPESEARPSEAAANTVKIDGCTFAPTVARVAAGSEVRFINASEAFHDIVGRDGAWGTDGLDVGRTFSYTFQDEGLYPFSCSLHPGMAGVIVVGEPAVAEAPDLQAAAAVAPVDSATTATGDGGSPTALIAAGAVGLLGGLAIGAIGMRLMNRREPAD